MIEHTLIESSPVESGENAQLQAVEWPVLVARLAAARDLRGVFAHRDSASGGNFSDFSAGESIPLNETGTPINLDGLADGKAGGAILRSTADRSATPSRELT